MVERINCKALVEDALHIFHNGFACSESVIYALRKHFAWGGMTDDAIAMSSGFPWGLGGVGCLCGAVAGGTMCIGYCFGRRVPGDPCINKCFALTKEFGDAVVAEFGSCCCGKLIEEFEDRNSPERKCKCAGIVAFCAEKAARIIAREQGIAID